MNAFETAAALAKRHQANLHLFYVAEKNLVEMEAETDLYSSSVNTDVLMAIASAIEHKHEVRPTVVEVEGNVAECIAKAAAQLPADLIVMGTHGASGVRDGFIGTNTYNTVKYAICPVLTLPPGRKITAFRKVLFPVRPVSGALTAYTAADCFVAANATIDIFGLTNRSDMENALVGRLVDEVRSQGRWSTISTRTYLGSLSHAPEALLQHTATVKTRLSYSYCNTRPRSENKLHWATCPKNHSLYQSALVSIEESKCAFCHFLYTVSEQCFRTLSGNQLKSPWPLTFTVFSRSSLY